MQPRLLQAALLAASLGVGCGAAGGAEPAAGAGEGSAPAAAADAPFVRPKGLMSRQEAERFALALINRDRKQQGLRPVAWDATAARAGQRHADDMARSGFTAHTGTDGSVPEQRHTEAGGGAMVMENAGCFADGVSRELDPNPRFTAESIEKIERAFMDEVPPYDGHRRNILTAWHTAVGVGLSKTKDLGIACMAQEFVDVYGDYAPLPRKARVGAKIKVAGKLRAPATVAGVGLSRIDKPRAWAAKELLQTGSYSIPKPFRTYFPKGFKTLIPLDIRGSSFSIEVPLSDESRSGLYSVSVWAKLPDAKDLVMVSLRTIDVD